MYVFATAVLFALGIMALAHCVHRFVPSVGDYRSLVMVVFGIAGAWLADFDLWARFGQPVREEWIGMVLTGLALGGLAHVWHEGVDWFSGMARKTNDEAAALEKTQGLKAA